MSIVLYWHPMSSATPIASAMMTLVKKSKAMMMIAGSTSGAFTDFTWRLPAA